VGSPLSPILSPGQIQVLAARGEERTAAEGEFLFRIGDVRYPLIVVLEGEAAVLDAAGNEIARQGAGGFLGEMNLLTGQTVFVDGVVTEPMRYIAVDRDELRPLLHEDGSLADVMRENEGEDVVAALVLDRIDGAADQQRDEHRHAHRQPGEPQRPDQLAAVWAQETEEATESRHTPTIQSEVTRSCSIPAPLHYPQWRCCES
jgi:CRP-like cAMP-binding protein